MAANMPKRDQASYLLTKDDPCGPLSIVTLVICGTVLAVKPAPSGDFTGRSSSLGLGNVAASSLQVSCLGSDGDSNGRSKRAGQEDGRDGEDGRDTHIGR